MYSNAMAAPRFSDSFINELKSRVRISDIVGRKVKLVKKGKEWSGLSPFTAEKTPSFYVNDQKQFFKDFSSGKFGDVISFLQETERLSFTEAVTRLAEEAGMELPQDTPQDRAERSRRGRLLDACEAACRFFEESLRGPQGAPARAYLEGRGLKPDSWARHRIGFAPDGWRNLQDKLKAQNVSVQDMLDTGLIIQPDNGKEPYDRFRGRVIFPIEDAAGHVIAFGGRAMEKDAKPKYLNSPETDLFHKGHVLYRYRKAREAAAMANKEGLIVCEGYMDAIALTEAGFGNAVAPLGTALTEDQLSLLWKVGGEPILCFDGDEAGLRAAYKAIDRALPHLAPGRSLFFTLLPDGLDPDDLIRERGRDAMREELEGAKPLVELLWARELQAHPLDTPERQAGFEQRMDDAINAIPHAGVKKAYGRELHQRMRNHFFEMRRGRRQPGRPPAGEQIGLKPAYNARGLRLLIRLIDSPALLEASMESLSSVEFPDPVASGLKDAIFDMIENGEEVDRAGLTSHLRTLGKEKCVRILQSEPKLDPIDPTSPEGQEWLSAVTRLFAVDELSEDRQRLRGGVAEKEAIEPDHASQKARLRAEIIDLTRGRQDDAGPKSYRSELKDALKAFDEAVERKKRK